MFLLSLNPKNSITTSLYINPIEIFQPIFVQSFVDTKQQKPLTKNKIKPELEGAL